MRSSKVPIYKLFIYLFFLLLLRETKTAHKFQSISNKKQKDLLEREKMSQQILRNQEIRQSNFQRFFKNREFDPFASKNFKAPWGLDQQKFKKYLKSLQANEPNSYFKRPIE